MIGHDWERIGWANRAVYTCRLCQRRYTGYKAKPSPEEKVVHYRGKYITCEETREHDIISDVMDS